MKNKTRKDCFWGLHFDFHADVDSVGIGIQNTAEDVGRYLDAAKPDYIHYDTKGHPGYTSYCTKYGNAAPGIEADFLKVVREETKKRGILLFAHYSGILEELASKRHPEWTVLDEEGKPTTRMDVTGPYVEELMIPQLIELAVEYGLDGAWIDGDCWAWQENWNPEYLEGFYEKSGYRSIDPDLNSPSHLAFREYCRNTFTDYLKHYMTEIKKAAPGFEITSNCAYGHFIPQKPLDEIDYLTEDAAPYAGGEGYLARCFARSGKPWDIGDWGGTCLTEKRYAAVYRNRKCVDWICREASRAISLGGGFTSSNTLTMHGKMLVNDEAERIARVSAYVYARKPYNWGSAPLENAAVYLSDYNGLRTSKALYGNPIIPKIACQVVWEGGRPVDVIFDYHLLENRLGETKTIILPETEYMSQEIKDKLHEFTAQGGNLIVCGVNTCKLLEDMAKAEMCHDKYDRVYVGDTDLLYGIPQPFVSFEGNGCADVCKCYADIMDRESLRISSVICNAYEKGNVVFIGFNLFSEYQSTHNYVLRDVMRKVLDTVEPQPYAFLEKGIHRVEIIPAKKDGKLLINLINLVDAEDGLAGYDEIVPLQNLMIAVKCDHRPESVMLQPDGICPSYSYDGQYLHVMVEHLAIHSIIVIE